MPEDPAVTCTGRCGQVVNTCGQLVTCTPCTCDPACAFCQQCHQSTNTCEPDLAKDGLGCGACQVCAGGQCLPCPGCCDSSGTCYGGKSNTACGSDNEQCQNCTLTHQVCQSDGSCACDAASCPAGQVCGGDGTCCYATAEAFQAALANPAGPATIRLCAGTISLSPGEFFIITRPVTIIGAGDGAGGTVLAQGGGGFVVGVQAGTQAEPVRLEHLAMTGGSIGVLVDQAAHCAMTDCTVRDNRRGALSHGLVNDGTLTLTRCQIRDNGPVGTSDDQGGGLANFGTATLIGCCLTGNLQSEGGGI